MYKFLVPVFILFIAIASSSCNKNFDSKCPLVTVNVPDSEMTALATYIDTSHVAAVRDSRGFYYAVSDTGIGAQPTACSVIKVNYAGKFTNGRLFDSGHNSSFTLSQLISGWQVGIPLIRNGGHITLYLPPSLGYGATGSSTVPAGSILTFSIELVGVQ